ncbi:GNAT family N-acetyltransferase, partial [Citrobacter sp. AAK_AS5]
EEVRHFTHVDHDARVALVVLLGDVLIAVGRCDRAPKSDAAEVALGVDDAQQGRGIATRLLEQLASAAQERGITRFTADVL